MPMAAVALPDRHQAPVASAGHNMTCPFEVWTAIQGLLTIRRRHSHAVDSQR
jgi:hypothetical protein